MVFLKPFCVNVRIVSSNRPKPFPSTFFPVHHSQVTLPLYFTYLVQLKRWHFFSHHELIISVKNMFYH
jgi:hypothetical protein